LVQTAEVIMQLSILETIADSLSAGYECPCGCRPTVAYARHGDVAYDACCCGNEFAFGPSAHVSLADRGGFERSTERLQAPWGEVLEAAWLIGPSTHSDGGEHGHETHQHELPMAPAQRGAGAMDSAIDPVCGMTVDREAQRAKGLVSTYEGREYFFCGKGCKLDFEEDPARYFDPTYQPTM
jgi:YHS domain-containing protein